MLYHFFDLQHALLTPARLMAEATRTVLTNPLNPLSFTQGARTVAAGAEVFERATRKFGKPDWNLGYTKIDGRQVDIVQKVLLEKPFCNLLHFRRKINRDDPKVLIVAPMSGHYATLLRGTVKALLPHHDVYITDWIDARQVPLSAGKFDLDSYIAYVREFISMLGPDVHLIAVCQPAVPVYAAVALMEEENNPNRPLSMTLMGGPVDARVSKTQVTKLAEDRPLSWFEKNVVTDVPMYYPGGFRKVYPGFVQLSGFMSMNLDRHIGSSLNFYKHLVQGAGHDAEHHRNFYDEYLAVMDITGEFYLQTVETVFQNFALPRGKMIWKDPFNGQSHKVNPGAITRTALLTVEGELDDISAHGQTTAAHEISVNLPADKQYHHFQLGAGHYGIFNGSRWQKEIMPRVRHFIRQMDPGRTPVPVADFENKAPDLSAPQYDRNIHGIDAVRARNAKKAPPTEAEKEKSGFHNAEEDA